MFTYFKNDKEKKEEQVVQKLGQSSKRFLRYKGLKSKDLAILFDFSATCLLNWCILAAEEEEAVSY